MKRIVKRLGFATAWALRVGSLALAQASHFNQTMPTTLTPCSSLPITMGP